MSKTDNDGDPLKDVDFPYSIPLNEEEYKENRRKFLAGLDEKTREYAIKMFADLGLTQ